MIVGALALGVIALPAAAFQETTVGGKPQEAAPVAPPAAVAPANPAPDAGRKLQLSVPEIPLNGKGGTEIKIPGIGTVGVVPKLDFGLELLYGATDQKPATPDSREDPSDVRIRGTLKHRF